MTVGSGLAPHQDLLPIAAQTGRMPAHDPPSPATASRPRTTAQARGAQDSRRRQLLAAGLGASVLAATAAAPAGSIRLPAPARGAPAPLMESLARRRSVRAFTQDAVSLADGAELLWAAQGVSAAGDLRTAPSAGALHPLHVFLLAQRVRELDPGLYRYQPAAHALEPLGPLPAGWPTAVAGQAWITAAPLVLAIAAATDRTAARYGSRAARYVAIEAGAAAQNLALRATALGLGCVCVGAFHDDLLRRELRLAAGLDPLLLVPVGHPAAR